MTVPTVVSVDYVALVAAITIIGIGVLYAVFHDPDKPFWEQYDDDGHDDEDCV